MIWNPTNILSLNIVEFYKDEFPQTGSLNNSFYTFHNISNIQYVHNDIDRKFAILEELCGDCDENESKRLNGIDSEVISPQMIYENDVMMAQEENMETKMGGVQKY